MTRILLKIYDYLSRHTRLGYATLVAATVVLVLLVSRLGYKEDIQDFIPFGGKHATALKMYQNMSGAGRVFVIFQHQDTTHSDPDQLVDAVDTYVDALRAQSGEMDSINIVSEVNMDLLDEMMEHVYSNIPYLLTDQDYDRIDSLLQSPGYIASQLDEDKMMLQFPSGGLLVTNLSRDPLNLFTPVAERLQASGSQVRYENYEGHIFTPDMKTAIVMLDTPYGVSESEGNSRLLDSLRTVAQSTQAQFKDLRIDFLGNPVIAVGNASQIKTDSIISISIAVVLILALLMYVFRSGRNITLIAVSIAWGWLFALACLSLLHDRVSIIVIGISSVILGIAVNYPLHVIAHITHDSSKRTAFREIITPLLVGNITTVGAFLALVPLQSIALRDLGLFASFLLLGTIVFSLVFLPHLTRTEISSRRTFIDRLGELEPETKPWLVAVIVALTVVLGYFSLDIKFDSNMAHINYMTDADRANMEYFQRMLMSNHNKVQLYALSSDSTLAGAIVRNEQLQFKLAGLKADGQLDSYGSVGDLVASPTALAHRLERWDKMVATYKAQAHDALVSTSKAKGFAEGSFQDFYNIIDAKPEKRGVEDFLPMAQSLHAGYIMHDETTGEYHVASVASLDSARVDAVTHELEGTGAFCYNMQSINSAIANNLSDNFNYIGWACGLIVFFFLWLSMGNLEMAIISFTPMAVSWVWILGLMSLLDVQFNIVNIILATFIFGQGDDYTIFITEGASYEYTHRKKILASYKHSIIVSAIIMFCGIGTLILAKHPALLSLAQVTIIGMAVVVLMAYLLPPLLFKWLVSTRQGYRRRPITLGKLLRSALVAIEVGVMWFIRCIYAAMLVFVKQEKRKLLLHRLERSQARFVLNHIPGVKFDAPVIDAEPGTIAFSRTSSLDWLIARAVGGQSIVVHGADDVAPLGSWVISSGTITVRTGQDYSKLRGEVETEEYFIPLVKDRYRYKGKEVWSAVIKGLKNRPKVDVQDGVAVIETDGYGECALLYALAHHDTRVVARMNDPERANVLRHSAQGIVDNLTIETQGKND